MKKISLILILSIAALSCSKDNDEQSCNCEKVTASYNESMQAYEILSTEPYSKSCDDYNPHYNPDGKGTYYMIKCN